MSGDAILFGLGVAGICLGCAVLGWLADVVLKRLLADKSVKQCRRKHKYEVHVEMSEACGGTMWVCKRCGEISMNGPKKR